MSRQFLFSASMDEKINARLTRRIEYLAMELLGTPSCVTGVDMKWGTDGNIVVRTRGRWRGKFAWATKGEFGDALALIMTARNINRSSARQFAMGWLDS